MMLDPMIDLVLRGTLAIVLALAATQTGRSNGVRMTRAGLIWVGNGIRRMACVHCGTQLSPFRERRRK